MLSRHILGHIRRRDIIGGTGTVDPTFPPGGPGTPVGPGGPGRPCGPSANVTRLLLSNVCTYRSPLSPFGPYHTQSTALRR